MISVSVANPNEIADLPFALAKQSARHVLEQEGISQAKISLAFVDNTTIHRINKQFLQHDEPTDVITFPLSGKGAKKLEGELVIGYEVAKEKSAELGHALEHELLLYVIHGILHLCGYDDLTAKDAKEMRKMESLYLKQLQLPDIAGE